MWSVLCELFPNVRIKGCPLDTGSLEEGRQKIVIQSCRIHCFSLINIYYKKLKHCYQEDMTLNINSLQAKTCETFLFAFVDEINLKISESAKQLCIKCLRENVKILTQSWLSVSSLQIWELGFHYQYNLYLCKFMALPFLPEDNIQPMFEQLHLKATTDHPKQFVNYVSETWISSNTWPPSSWSVYMMAIRSNNNVEGWHNGLHHCASGRCHMAFYLLIGLLHEEARLTALRIWLVSERKLKRIQRDKFRSLQAKIFDLWDDFLNQRKNAEQLLRQCAHLHGPLKAFTQCSS